MPNLFAIYDNSSAFESLLWLLLPMPLFGMVCGVVVALVFGRRGSTENATAVSSFVIGTACAPFCYALVPLILAAAGANPGRNSGTFAEAAHLALFAACFASLCAPIFSGLPAFAAGRSLHQYFEHARPQSLGEN